MSFPLSQGLYDKVTESHTSCLYTRIQLLRGGESIEDIADTPNETLEIGIPKKAYLAIFTEGHSFFQGKYPSAKNVRNMSQHELECVYIACIALLSTTNDHSTIWRVHESVVLELAGRSGGSGSSWVKKDFTYMIALATSCLDKINKSSVLWHWLRKLAVVCVFRDFSNSKFYIFCKHVLRSMDAHFANYAAGFTLVWLVQVARSLELHFDEMAVLSLLREYSRKRLGDISLWTAFGRILSDKKCVYAETLYRNMSSRFECEVSFNQDPCLHDAQNDDELTGGKLQPGLSEYPEKENAQIGNMSQLKDMSWSAQFSLAHQEALCELQWLLDVQCVVESPYKHVISGMPDLKISQRMIHQKLESLDVSKETETSRKFRFLLQGFLE
ncbi:hypothetical protein JCM33374_g1309 [Metschnikowia sp. JCM 33374]|nr:hypothetical protein JCM33374_g1309 [Metschnikowia sp. JCM 33374]